MPTSVLISSDPLYSSIYWPEWAISSNPVPPERLTCLLLPARLGENDYSTGAALEGRLDCTNGYGLWRVVGQCRGAPQLLKQLPVERGGLCLSCNLSACWGGIATQQRRVELGKGGVTLSHTINICCARVRERRSKYSTSPWLWNISGLPHRSGWQLVHI